MSCADDFDEKNAGARNSSVLEFPENAKVPTRCSMTREIE
jgi:hypothetical protein